MGEPINKYDRGTGIDALNSTGGSLDDGELDFWQDVFKAVATCSNSFEAAEEWADRAVLASRRRRGL